MMAFIITNRSGKSLRLKSQSFEFKDLQLKTDEEYLFKSLDEYKAFAMSVNAWVGLRKIEVQKVEGKAAERQIEKTIVTEDQNIKDFDEDFTQSITVVDTVTTEKATTESEATETEETKKEVTETEENKADESSNKPDTEELKEELAGLELLLKESVEVEAKRRISTRIRDIKKLLK